MTLFDSLLTTNKCVSSLQIQSSVVFVSPEIEVLSIDVVCRFIKEDVDFNKHIFPGAAILDLSKMLMFKFHYNVVRAKTVDRDKFLFTDADSLSYYIEIEAAYKDL